MPQLHATIHGHVTYREGDGVHLPIPPGPVDLQADRDSVTLGWREDNGAAGSAALPRADFDRYVRHDKIRFDNQ